LQLLAEQIGVEIRVAHYPSYCSKYNGSLVISGVRNYLIFYANKAYPDRSRWMR
jgi:uncharacterized protein (DUF3820 family)